MLDFFVLYWLVFKSADYERFNKRIFDCVFLLYLLNFSNNTSKREEIQYYFIKESLVITW